MKLNTRRIAVTGVLLLATLAVLPTQSQATSGSGVTASALVRASFIDDVGVKFKLSPEERTVVANAKDGSDVAFQTISLAPGGHTGWHSHPGPVVVAVSGGSLAFYDGEGPCVRRSYAAGTAFVDQGMGHVHIARNESTTATVVLTVLYFAVPAGQPPRIDAVDPGNCRF